MEKVALDKTNGMRNGVSHLYTTIPSHLLILAALLYHFFFLCELETNDTLVKKPLELRRFKLCTYYIHMNAP